MTTKTTDGHLTFVLGDLAHVAANEDLLEPHLARARKVGRVGRRAIRYSAPREVVRAILYYLESCPAFCMYGGEGTDDYPEHRAASKAVARLRALLGEKDVPPPPEAS